jgi:DNA-binding Lrp family transcriptional regulator
MGEDSSTYGRPERDAPQDVRPVVDATDRAILRILRADARISNKELAERVGIAQSTCLTRVRDLRRNGVIRGFHADVDPRALGLHLQALIAIRLHPCGRSRMSDFVADLSAQPEVLDIYFVAGADDYLVHVATPSADSLRRFVAEHLSQNPSVAHTETSLIFEHTPAAGRGL